MGHPKVTVLMSVYNGEKFLRKAVDSILNQTYKNFEFLIINDFSTDSSRDIILSYRDPRIRLIDNQENIGLTRSLNKGLKLARGEYVARMDSDDISLPQRIEKQIEFLEQHPKVVLLGSWAEIIDQNEMIKDIWKYPTNHCFIAWKLLFGNCLVHSAVMYRKDCILDSGGYNELTTYAQDYELWIKLSSAGEIIQLPEVLVKCRKDIPESIGGRFLDKQLQIAVKAAFHYAKSMVNDITYDTFVHFFQKTTSNKLDFQAVRKVMKLTAELKASFFRQNNCDPISRREIAMDLRGWLKKWAVSCWKNPLVFLYLAGHLVLLSIQAGKKQT